MMIDVETTDGLIRHGQGLYEATNWQALVQFDHSRNSDNQSVWYWSDDQWPEMTSDNVQERLAFMHKAFQDGTWFQVYGSCDSPEQFMTTETGKKVAASPHPLIVIFAHFTRESSPDYRWHKQGKHIGLKEPQCEHFDDEPEISEIYTFHVYRKR